MTSVSPKPHVRRQCQCGRMFTAPEHFTDCKACFKRRRREARKREQAEAFRKGYVAGLAAAVRELKPTDPKTAEPGVVLAPGLQKSQHTSTEGRST